MCRLTDMLHFPAAVNAGATVNVLLTIAATWWVAARFRQVPTVPLLVLWIAVILSLNLAPVVLLRTTLRPDTPYPPLGQMDFFRDQHKFSDWIYLAASANMAFWILLAWTAATLRRTPASLAGVLVLAALATFSPVLARGLFKGSRAR